MERYGNKNNSIRLMGIDTDQFGMTAWMKEGLLSFHMNDYLNLITDDPFAALISQMMADAWDVQVGDTIDVSWPGTDRLFLTKGTR